MLTPNEKHARASALADAREREKLAAEEAVKREMKRTACPYCYGRGWGDGSPYRAMITCTVCKGSGLKE